MIRIIFAVVSFLICMSAAHAETVLVTGANRGIGFEFVRQYAARGWSVIATARDPDKAVELNALAAQNPNVSVAQLDVSDDASIKALATKYKGQSIDVLINNAGLLGDLKGKQKLGSLDRREFETLMTVNAFGALAVADAFKGNVARSTLKKIVAVSSGNGSVSEKRVPGGLYFYPASKAALNIMMRGLASELEPQGIAVGVLSPGGVDTDMGRTAGGNRRPQNMPASESVAGMMRVIDQLNTKNNNVFYGFDGSTRPW
jgi:NAD(P)-dependent dehydrogenase (short-subunit alcohol dehydrogenase family)